MTKSTEKDQPSLPSFMNKLKERHPGESEFHQTVQEFLSDIIPFLEDHPEYHSYALLDRMTEPDRIVSFRVTWLDDNEQVQVNRGYRVQFNNALGPYKGGIRFHPTVNRSILKFLGFEQIFKNSLTHLPLGGAKGGADFDPKGKSEWEIMRFCQAFMTELQRYLGPETDVPAGDIGVGNREIGYLFGAYKKLRNVHNGAMTGKGEKYGGSALRKEATGFGCAYFANEMLLKDDDSLKGKKCIVSGAGNVAQHLVEKILQLGGTVHAISDSSGTVFDEAGIDEEKLEWIKQLKNERRGRIEEYAQTFDLDYRAGAKPWNIPCDIAFPCATQHEINEHDARNLVDNDCIMLVEGSNMPLTADAQRLIKDSKILYAPGKAANAGGVATSGLEMAQNSMKLSWSAREVDAKLKEIMQSIHARCVEYGREKGGEINYSKGANIAGFVRVADAMIAQGIG